MIAPDEIIVDLFAGGGGASTGMEEALGRSPDVAVNHDFVAIAMHEANHPHTVHLRQNIWTVSPLWATRRRPVGLLWASPDCRDFSKAKGGPPKRSREIRCLAWAVWKWALLTGPRIIFLENVEEFRKWGPLDSRGKPVKSQRGTTFRAFVRRLRRLGYAVEYRDLRASTYGAPTIRKRFFLIARRDGMPIVWPEPTHGPGLEPYKTAAEIIDWSLPCPSIFERKRPLAENTLRRIAEGIRRYVINSAEPFIVTYYGEKRPNDFRGINLGSPLPTQTTENRFGLIIPHLQRQFGNSVGHPANLPSGTVTAGGGGKSALVSAFLARIGQTGGNGKYSNSTLDPLTTVTTKAEHLTCAVHLAKHYGGVIGHGPDKTLGTVTTKDHHSLVASNLIKLRGTSKAGQSPDSPLHTVTSGGNHLGEVRAFLIKYYGQSKAQAATEPCGTLTTRDRFGLVTVMIGGEPYYIADIGMRMLSPRELFRAQGFPDSYDISPVVNGKKISKADQVRMCGNSVCPPIARALVSANVMLAGNVVAA